MKSLITAVILSASLALSGNVAMAAAGHAKTAAAPHVVHHVAAAKHRPVAQRETALPNIFPALFGLPGAYALPGHAGSKADLGEYVPSTESPTFDTSSPIAVDTSTQAALDAMSENQAIEQMNDTNALTASMAAAEEQNDEANAATLQTEINAGM